jgi:predicted phage baseplate assembly protein
MDFDFLPKLPNSNLDDRAYRDLIEECILRIPRYCPEWTNHNPSDPGITLIELFAWLTDQMQLRFNQVPRRNYVAFLELLGIRLQPPTPAKTALTFYLSSAQDFPITISRDTEVATERTETETAIVFSTDRDLIVGNPRIKHFLSADTAETRPTRNILENPFNNSRFERDHNWEAINNTSLFRASSPGNCFYLVLDTVSTEATQSIQGNVLELIVRGEPATGTGINPDQPPRRWEAWDGKAWQNILRQELDDRTKGFNFALEAAATPGQPGLRSAAIRLHLPQVFPETEFGNYQGHWIRCVYQVQNQEQQTYSTSPRIVGLQVRAIGGAVNASQCIRVKDEFLGVSTGKPGQTFQLQMQPVLERQPDEVLGILLPGQTELERWEEVKDFSQSEANSPHYTIDSRTGTIQLGPLIRGPMRLRQNTYDRARSQADFQTVATRFQTGNLRERTLSPLTNPDSPDTPFIERQYGRVPVPAAELYLTSYRFGGGAVGNVQPEKLTILRSSLPYVHQVTNYEAAVGGTNAESLEEAVMRVPQRLRTRESAITPEDFEQVTQTLPGGKVARVHCMREEPYITPGVVRLLVVPRLETEREVDWTQGIHPDRLSLSADLKQEIDDYLRDRRPLGIKVDLQSPKYVGVSVRLTVLAEPRRDQVSLSEQLKIALYKFLNPLIGGLDGQGWPLGRPVYTSDIIALCQKVPGIRHLGAIELFEMRHQEDGWSLFAVTDSVIAPGPLSYICSWANHSGTPIAFAPHGKSDPGHEIHFMES